MTVLAAILVLLCSPANAQIHKFRQYTTRDGLRHQFVYSIEQDKHGFLWFATGLGLNRFDGINFTTPYDDLPTANVNTSFKDKYGNLWFGYSNGLTVKYDGNSFSVADTSVTQTAVTQIVQAPDDAILVATQTGGITRIINNTIERFEENFDNVMITALCFAGEDKLLVGTFDGLFLYSYGKEIALLTSIDELEYLSVVSITPKSGNDGFWVATAEDGIFFVSHNENDFTVTPIDIPELYYVQVQALYEDKYENLWISTFGEGVLKVYLSSDLHPVRTTAFNSSNGMGSDNARQVFFDNRQNLWVATFGQGIANITNLAFSFFDDLTPVDNNATAVLSIDDTEYWIAGTGVIIRITSGAQPERTIFGRANGLPVDRITALRKDDNGNLWIGTEKSGLYILPDKAQNATLFYSENNLLSNHIQNFIIKDDKIWMATRNGVIILNSQNKQKTEHYTTFEGGLPHNDIRDIFKDTNGRVWIATNSNSLVDVDNLSRLHLEKEFEDITNLSRLYLPNEFETALFSTIAQDREGRIWAGTIGRGVYVFDEQKDTVFHITSENNGLMSDFCYAMTFDGNGQMWVGHRLGISSINTERFTIKTFSTGNGIFGDVNPLAMLLNNSGEVLIGMTDGVMKYEVSADRIDELPPMLNLTRILINDVPYSVHTPIIKKFGRYKLQFEFVGLQYADPGSVTYQYYLQNYDLSWSPVTKSTNVIYPRLEDGAYYLYVKACNSGICTDETLLFYIKIRKPFWKTWWFIVFSIVSAIALVFTIITVRERNQRKLQ